MEDIHSFQEVIDAAAWDAAFFATYALSLSFFEAVPLIGLRSKGCRNIRIMADVDGYRASMSEAGAAHVGRTYDVTPVRVIGGHCFHPKLSVVVGKEGARAMVGSGNMTFMGWGGNLEFMDYLAPEAAPAAFADIAGFLGALADTKRLQSGWPDLSQVMSGCMTAAGRARDGRVRFIHNLVSPLADQLRIFADEVGGATTLRVIAPFWGTGAAVVDLSRMLGVDNVAIGVCEQSGERFPFETVERGGLNVRAVTGDLLKDGTRKLHGKLVVIEGRRGDIVLTGSANGSEAALTRLQNVEGGVLRIIETSSRLGWQPVPRPPCGMGFEAEEGDASQAPVLFARFDGEELAGQVLIGDLTEQMWTGWLSDGRADRKVGVKVICRRDGSFSTRDRPVRDFLLQSGNAVLLELSTGALEAAGWVTQTLYLEAVRERGPLAENLIRLLSGSEDEKDLEAILQYFAEHPNALVLASSRRQASTSTTSPVPVPLMVDPRRLGPIADGAIPRSENGGLGGGASAFDQLLRRFRAYVGSLPDRRDDKGQGDDLANVEDGDEDEGLSQRPRTRRAGADLKTLLEAFEKLIEARKGTEGAREDLLTYLDVVLFVTPRIDNGEEARGKYLMRWRRLVSDCAPLSAEIDALERAFALVVVATSQGRDSDTAIHGALQRRVCGMLSSAYLQHIVNGGSTRLAQRLLPAVGAEDWQKLMDQIVLARTPWMDAKDMWDCIQSGRAVEDGNSLLSEHEGADLIEMIAGRRPKDQLVAVSGSQENLSYCPVHRIRLPEVQIGRLLKCRLGRTSFCCRKILINLEP